MRRFLNLASLPSQTSLAGKTRRSSSRLSDLVDFGHNPGALNAKYYLPEDVTGEVPLVVVLHGCTQTADQYDLGSGWSAVAQQHGFALLFPEQQRANNPNLCFNWFLPQDNRRDRGEALSIRNMIAAMIDTHQLDATRVYVTGLSAGGAMANVMLATYPELFAGGAIIAGLPYGTARDVPQALERMRGQAMPGPRELAGLVKQATNHEGPWPAISIWHGSADATVYPSNADASLEQWLNIHGLAAKPTRTELVDGYPRQVWCDKEGRECVEVFTITGMSHGTPIATSGPDACGKAMPYMLDRKISSTHHICRFWRLSSSSAADVVVDKAAKATEIAALPSSSHDSAEITVSGFNRLKETRLPPRPSGVAAVIEDALRAAGLMR